MLKAEYTPYLLHFREPAITSRAVMTDKETYFIKIYDERNPEVFGIGECALFRGLSAEDGADYESVLAGICADISTYGDTALIPHGWSSIRFGIESALADLRRGGKRILWPGRWTDGLCGIPINGLVWMGSHDLMMKRLCGKIETGYRCIKLKIGGISFDEELDLIKHIRRHFSPEELELRLDANGAFAIDSALEYLRRLSPYGIHSIEHPIRAGHVDDMARICRESPIPIALDEELIGCRSTKEKEELLDAVAPAYIILKPSLCGGFSSAAEWVSLAIARKIGWWATSALESDIGLNAIAQWCASMNTVIPQGLGTGQLFTNNIVSPLCLKGDSLCYDSASPWILPQFAWR